MAKDESVYLGHMLDHARKVVGKVAGKCRANFDEDENLRLALAHLIQTIGEAARKVAPETRAAHPEIPWKRIMGMRHKIVHDYMEIDEDVVWNVATKHLAALVEQLEQILPDEPSAGVPEGE
jgi:uncharacterized protein with HEPN domain